MPVSPEVLLPLVGLIGAGLGFWLGRRRRRPLRIGDAQPPAVERQASPLLERMTQLLEELERLDDLLAQQVRENIKTGLAQDMGSVRRTMERVEKGLGDLVLVVREAIGAAGKDREAAKIQSARLINLHEAGVAEVAGLRRAMVSVNQTMAKVADTQGSIAATQRELLALWTTPGGA